jgi:hypothetical protein
MALAAHRAVKGDGDAMGGIYMQYHAYLEGMSN